MPYDLNNLGTSRKPSPYLSYGGNQILKVNKIELVKAGTSDSKKAIIHMESQPVKDPTFEPVPGAKGKVGKIGMGVFMKHEKQRTEFLEKLKIMAIAMGLEEEVKLVSGDVFEDVVAGVEEVLKTGNRYAKYTIFGEEYAKSNGTVGLRLIFPRWNFVEPVDVKESSIIQFDINNPLHFKKVKKEEAKPKNYAQPIGKSISDQIDDLPF